MIPLPDLSALGAARRQAMRVGFLTTLGVNVGDEFIREGVRHCLDRLDWPVEPYFVNKHDEASVRDLRDVEWGTIGDKIRDADVFIQSGAPVYWHHGPGRHNSTMTEWHGWAWEDRILGSSGAPAFINLGAGSCQPWGDNGDAFVNDPACADFARRAGLRAAITTVRDPLASDMLTRLGVAHVGVPCPALLAAGKLFPARPASNLIGVNLMPKGGHYDFTGAFDSLAWMDRLHTLMQSLRRMGRLIFVCHDEEEERFAGYFATGSERTFRSAAYRDYLDLFRVLTGLFANRVHAAVTAAGFGVPAIIAGVDTRARIGEWIGLDVVEAAAMDPAAIADRMAALLAGRPRESDRLLTLREQTVERYVGLLGPVLNGVTPRAASAGAVVAEHPVKRCLERDAAAREWRDRLGMAPLWVIRESGFHAPEAYSGGTLRWTDGNAVLSLPAELEAEAERLEFSLWGVHPGGYRFHLRVNGTTVLDTATDAAGAWDGSVAFPACTVREIAITSDVMRPEGESRALGVAVRSLRLPARKEDPRKEDQ